MTRPVYEERGGAIDSAVDATAEIRANGYLDWQRQVAIT
jgi:hypothetical protein